MGGVHMPPLWSYIPHTFGCPPYIQSFNTVFILLYHKMFSYFRGRHEGLSDLGDVHMPPYVHMPHVCLDTLIYLDTPYMFGYPSVCLGPAPVCLDAPCMSGHPHMFGCPICLDTSLYVWMIPIVWMSPMSECPMFGHPPVCLDAHTFGCPHTFGVHLSIWQYPNIQGAFRHRQESKHTGDPNIWGHLDIQGASKHIGGI